MKKSIVVILMMMLALGVMAQTSTKTYTASNGAVITYQPLTDGSCILIKIEKCQGDLVIPSYLSTYYVKYLAVEFFRDLKDMTSLTLPDGITSLAAYCFANCPKLTKVVAEGVMSVDDYAFAGCKQLKSVSLDMLSYVGEGAFANCESLAGDFDFASNCKIGDFAFVGCKNLWIDLDLYSVTIGKHAFENADIKNLRVSGTSKIGESAFANNIYLKKVELAITNGGNTDYKVEKNAFNGCDVSNFIVEGGEPMIFEGAAFAGCKGTLHLSRNFKSGSVLVFSPLAYSLFSKVVYDKDVFDLSITVEPYTFFAMYNLKSIEFTPKVNIDKSMLMYCPSLTDFYMKNSDGNPVQMSSGCYNVSEGGGVTLQSVANGRGLYVLAPNVTKILQTPIYFATLDGDVVIDARNVKGVPELEDDVKCSATILVKPGMKKKFLEYAEANPMKTSTGTISNLYANSTIIEMAPDPIQDVNADGAVNAADVVNIYNYIIDGN